MLSGTHSIERIVEAFETLQKMYENLQNNLRMASNLYILRTFVQIGQSRFVTGVRESFIHFVSYLIVLERIQLLLFLMNPQSIQPHVAMTSENIGPVPSLLAQSRETDITCRIAINKSKKKEIPFFRF